MDLKKNESLDDSLSEAEKARIRKGKERALMIRQSRLTAHPYSNAYVVNNSLTSNLTSFK